MAQNQKEVLKNSLKFFIEPHPVLHPGGEKVFVPRHDLRIRFWFEGGFQIEGGSNDLQINFNSPSLLILALETSGESRIIRVPWGRLIAFELVTSTSVPHEVLYPSEIN